MLYGLVEVVGKKELGDIGQPLECPHKHLDWYQQYLWQKIKICLDRNVEIIFENDPKVVALFKEYAPEINVFQVR